MEFEIATLGFSALAGVVYGAIGYFRNKTQDKVFEGFAWKPFLITVFGSGIIGAGSQYMGMTPDAFSASAFGVIATQTLKKLFDIVWIKLK